MLEGWGWRAGPDLGRRGWDKAGGALSPRREATRPVCLWLMLEMPAATACPPTAAHGPLAALSPAAGLPKQAALGQRQCQAPPHLSFWILQEGLCRPWTTQCMPASPSSLPHRLSSVSAGLTRSAELMSLHRASVRPQSSSLQPDLRVTRATLRLHHYPTRRLQPISGPRRQQGTQDIAGTKQKRGELFCESFKMPARMQTCA